MTSAYIGWNEKGNNLLCAYYLNCKIGFVTLMLVSSFL